MAHDAAVYRAQRGRRAGADGIPRPDTMAAMDDPTTTEPTEPTEPNGGDPARPATPAKPADRRSADVESGDGPTNQPARLDHPPSDRYGREALPPAVTRRTRAGQALGVAAAGAAAIVFLGGPLSMTAGLLALSVVLGLVVGALLRPATAIAVSLAVGSVVVGLMGIWLFARAEGGVLDPIAYFGDVQGPLAPAQLVLAALAAVASSR